MNFKRILSIILAILTLLTVLSVVSCGDTEKTVETVAKTEAVSTDPEDTELEFKEADYGGETFTVYMRSSDASSYRGMYIKSDETLPSVADQAAVTRNQRTEEKYNFKFEFVETTNPNQTIVKDIAGGEVSYDCVLDKRNSLGTVALQGALLNLYNLDVDLTTDWWSANAEEAYSLCGMIFEMPNDVSVSNVGGARVIYFNKAVLENYKLTSPYEHVENNTWTLDTFISMAKSVQNVSTSETDFGTYGFVNETAAVRNHLITGCGIPWVEKTADDYYEVTFITTYADKTQQYLDKLKTLFEDKTCCMTFSEAHAKDTVGAATWSAESTHCRRLFAQDHFLFVQGNVSSTSDFEDMSKGFGVVPDPKWDSDQETYYNKVDYNSIIWAAPKYSGLDTERLGTIMDYWAYTSTGTVVEAYFEIILKTRRSSDPTAGKMFDLIKSTVGLYPSDVWGGTIGTILTDCYNTSVATAAKTWDKATKKSLEKTIAQIKALQE